VLFVGTGVVLAANSRKSRRERADISWFHHLIRLALPPAIRGRCDPRVAGYRTI